MEARAGGTQRQRENHLAAASFRGLIPGGTLSCSVGTEYFPFPVTDPNRLALEVVRESVAPFKAMEKEMEHALARNDLLLYGEIQERYQNAGGYTIDQLILRETAKLEVREEVLTRIFCTLSPGERVKLLLAALLLRPGKFLLIDEPTSHLDAWGRRTVGKYLAGGGKGFLLVSHDRELLDAATDHTLALGPKGAKIIHGSYSVWEVEKDRQDAGELALRQQLEKETSRLAEAVRRASGWSDVLESSKKGLGQNSPSGLRPDRGHIGAKSAALAKRAKSIENRRQNALKEKRGLLKELEGQEVLSLHILPARRRVLLQTEGLSADYGGGPIFPPVTFALEPGERLALTGPNGSGKSTLLPLLWGEDIPYTGDLWRAGELVFSCLSQDCSGLSGTLEDYAQAQKVDGDLVRAILRKLGFARELFSLPMEQYSQGQRKKIALAVSLACPAHIFLWDEPLNYLDILARCQLENLLLACSPSMILAEHDARFLRQIATKEVSLGNTPLFDDRR